MNLLPKILTTTIVAIVDIVGILLTNVGARPNLIYLKVLLLRLLPLASLKDLFSLYLQLTLRQLSTRSFPILVMHIPLSYLFC
jgi:hypothetical protein